ncbi:hypothetical protein D3C76_1702240 [compost metagenome]
MKQPGEPLRPQRGLRHEALLKIAPQLLVNRLISLHHLFGAGDARLRKRPIEGLVFRLRVIV